MDTTFSILERAHRKVPNVPLKRLMQLWRGVGQAVGALLLQNKGVKLGNIVALRKGAYAVDPKSGFVPAQRFVQKGPLLATLPMAAVARFLKQRHGYDITRKQCSTAVAAILSQVTSSCVLSLASVGDIVVKRKVLDVHFELHNEPGTIRAKLGGGRRKLVDSTFTPGDPDIANIKRALRRRYGLLAVQVLATSLDALDDNGDGELDADEIKWGLRDLGVDIDANRAVAIVAAFDKDRGGTLSIQEFLHGLRGDMPANRHRLVRRLFDELKRSSLAVADLKTRFNPWAHPSVEQGKLAPHHMTHSFFAAFDDAAVVTFDALLALYQNVSAVLENDDDFKKAVCDFWNLTATKPPPPPPPEVPPPPPQDAAHLDRILDEARDRLAAAPFANAIAAIGSEDAAPPPSLDQGDDDDAPPTPPCGGPSSHQDEEEGVLQVNAGSSVNETPVLPAAGRILVRNEAATTSDRIRPQRRCGYAQALSTGTAYCYGSGTVSARSNERPSSRGCSTPSLSAAGTPSHHRRPPW